MNYTADTLYYGQRQKMLGIKYSELLKPRVIDNRSGDEIVKDVMKHGGLRFKDEHI